MLAGSLGAFQFTISVLIHSVPDAPAVVVIPRYFYGNQSLIYFQVFVQGMVSFIMWYCVHG